MSVVLRHLVSTKNGDIADAIYGMKQMLFSFIVGEINLDFCSQSSDEHGDMFAW